MLCIYACICIYVVVVCCVGFVVRIYTCSSVEGGTLELSQSSYQSINHEIEEQVSKTCFVYTMASSSKGAAQIDYKVSPN